MSVKKNQFPTTKELLQVNVLGKFEKLYQLRHREVLGLNEVIVRQYKNKKDIVYLAHAIPAMISDFYGDFVQGDEEKLVISAGVGSPDKEVKFIEEFVDDNDLIETVYDLGVGQSEYGYTVVHVYKDEDGKIKKNLINQDQFFPQKDGSIIIATYIKDIEEAGKPIYVLTQHYQLENGKVKIERQGFKADQNGVVKEDVGVEKLNTLLRTSYKKEDTTLEIDQVPFVVIPNGRRNKEGLGKSDYIDIMPQLAEINERATHISTQLLKNMDAKLVLPKVQPEIGEDGKPVDDDGNVKNFDYIMLDGKEHIQGYYITNENPLIDASERHILMQIKMISLVSKVPMGELLKSSMPDRVEAMRIELFGATRKTNTKRAKIKKGLKEVLRIAAKLNGTELTEKPVVEMSDVLPTDTLQIVEAESVKITSGISSKKASMMRVESYTEDEAEAELEQIKKEDLINGVDVDNPPTV